MVTTAFAQDPTSGHLFLFVNRRRDRLKILYWDRDGLAIWYKRLEKGSFQLPAVARDAMSVEMSPTQLTLILSGIDLGRPGNASDISVRCRKPENRWCPL